ncbi:hypothetical protein NE619_13240 [Anaerovorax odorimutans]|uniref:Uncharacterized protein n=1 Tax=Anaerovorax odorimutans TaxID=109327 RepID=A0ABT1RR90_9FIRM|nr:hypothetical protein [Anaerovorax odorimutans]MCQ4637692.1 hypothetical protein [Anaerovorax odorimutans]
MSCKKNVCPEGLSTCCGDCIRKELDACKGNCDRLVRQEECVNYTDKSAARQQRRIEKKAEWRMVIWMAILLMIVLSVLGFAIHQSYKNAEYIDKIKSGQSVAAEQSASIPKGSIKQITYSISDLEVMSN